MAGAGPCGYVWIATITEHFLSRQKTYWGSAYGALPRNDHINQTLKSWDMRMNQCADLGVDR
jgi:hypothetical protein